MSSFTHKIWETAPVDTALVAALARELSVPKTFAALLLQRGIKSRGEAELFFGATLADLPSPFLMKGMEQAVKTVAAALEAQKPVVVYGDYDVDGTTGAAILSLFLGAIGFARVFTCQPLRLEEGYGLHLQAVKRTLQADISGQAPLLITVDCGISDHEEVRRFKELGWSVIVSDHHQPPALLPEADAVINPLQPGCGFPDKNLAGVGVAFYLLMGIRTHLMGNKYFTERSASPNLKEYLDLVAIGTVGDMVPLTGVNRILVKAGLEVLGQTKRPGLVELLRISGVKGGGVTCEDIGYRLGPRINAAGRLGSAERALSLLAGTDPGEAKILAEELSGKNEQRKLLIDRLFSEACVAAEEKCRAGRRGLVLHADDWHAGVIGIGASRVVERFHRPVLVFARQAGGMVKGSGRSVPGVNLYAILDKLRELFSHFGGHEAAVGLSLPMENLAELEERFDEAIRAQYSEEVLAPKIEIAWQDEDDSIGSREFLALHEKLAPFGMGNPEPIFRIEGTLDEAREVGVNHLKFKMKLNGANYDGIGFGLGDFLHLAESGQRHAVAFRLRKNSFRGEQRWQLDAADIRTI